MSKGDIVLVPFPFTDLSGQKVRPALVLYASKVGEDCILVFISSLQNKAKQAFDVTVSASSKNGLKIDSVIKCHKIATLQKKIVLGKIGVLEPQFISMIDQKIRILLKV